MKIAFDTLLLSERNRGVGIYQYAKNLFLEFRKLVRDRNDLSITYFVADGTSEEFLRQCDSLNYHAQPTRLLKSELLWRLGLVNLAAAGVKADVLFSPAPKLHPIAIPAVITIHDIMPLKLPHEVLRRRVAYRLTAQSWVAAKLATKIITDSEHSKKDIAECFGIDPRKIEVVYLGYDKAVFNTISIDSELQAKTFARFGIERPYIVHHGLVQSRKNVMGLIRSYEMLMHSGRFHYDLVLAGGFGPGAEEMRRAAARLTKGRVVFTGSLVDEEVGTILKGASLAVIPSFYEGFCLPIVEAMASGVPTIGANNSCIPEVTGHALRYFDAQSSEQMAAVMENVLESSDLQSELVAAGVARSSEFSWERCARETLDVICGAHR